MADEDNNKSGENAGTESVGKAAPKKNFNHRRKGKGGASNNVVAPPIPKEAGMARPGQTVKPTTFTKPRNETMFDELDIAGFNGMAPYHGRNRLAITAEGFIPLVEKEYNVLSSKEPHFGKTISRSMFVYYCVQHLYARLMFLRKSDAGEIPMVEEQMLELMNSGNFTLPDPIKAYIYGIGVVTDAAGVEYKLDFPAWPNRNGHFGRVSAETHFMYESLPAPYVVTKRIQEDLRYTIEQQQPNWQLPNELIPAEAGCGLPTKNLLGWAPAVALTSDQRACLEGLDVTVDDFPSRYGGFRLHVDLIARVSRALDVMMKIKTSKALMTSSVGSQALVSFTNVEISDYDFVRSTSYTELGNVRQVAAQQLDARASLAGLIMTYRCRKDTMNGRNYWCSYDFGEYANVPNTWVNTANNIFEYGRADWLNLMKFTTTYTAKDVYRETWLTRQCKA